MNQYTINTTYSAGTEGTVVFPEGKSWDDVKDWYVKWDTLHVQFKDSPEWQEFSLDSYVDGIIDWKRPDSVSVFPKSAEGTDWDTEIACN